MNPRSTRTAGPTPAGADATASIDGRRAALGGIAGACLALLAACSKSSETPSASPAPTAAPTSGTPATPAAPADAGARSAFETASRGTGFVVGMAMSARQVLVFFDPQCPHCAALWKASEPLLDRVRMTWMPVAFVGPKSAPQGAMLLAADDPKAAMDRHESALASGAGGLPVVAVDPALVDKVKANTELWKELGASSVPHLVWRTGVDGSYGVHPGAMPTAELAAALGL